MKIIRVKTIDIVLTVCTFLVIGCVVMAGFTAYLHRAADTMPIVHMRSAR